MWSRYLQQRAGHGAPNRRDEGGGHSLGVPVPEVHQGMVVAQTLLYNPWKESETTHNAGDDTHFLRFVPSVVFGECSTTH